MSAVMEKMTTKDMVTKMMRTRRWIAGSDLETQAGPSALRRMREMRGAGYEIKSRRMADGGYEYRLVASPK